MASLRITGDAVLRFAEWSCDRNPLHIDPRHARDTYFGRPIVHGALSVLYALRGLDLTPGLLDIEFNGALYADENYDVRTGMVADGRSVAVDGSDGRVLTAQYTPSARVDLQPLPWLTAALAHPGTIRQTPADRTLDDLQPGFELLGTYPPVAAPALDGVPHGLSRLLALCSYIVGMEAPGLRSLFTRLRLQWHADDPGPFAYRARILRLDRTFRILEIELEVAAPDGRPLASAAVTSYVPFSPTPTDIAGLESTLPAETAAALSGKTALVVGGTRGLGLEIATALSLAGCCVYASGRHAEDSDPALAALRASGHTLTVVAGDAADRDWCERTIAAIRERHGRVDLLILNACEQPQPTLIGAPASTRACEYVAQNLRLVEAPLAAAATALGDAAGAVVYLSSSFVESCPPGFAAYVALKQAGEAFVRTTAGEHDRLYTLIARPPVLQTRWNDTPVGVAGSIPARWAAVAIVRQLAEHWREGRRDTLVDFPEPARVRSESSSRFSLRLAASFTADPLLPALRLWAGEVGFSPDVQVAPYGQMLHALLAPDSVLNRRAPGVNVLLLRLRDWLRELMHDAHAPHAASSTTQPVASFADHLRETMRDFVRAIRTHRSQATGDTIVLLCPSHADASSADDRLLEDVQQDLVDALREVSGVQVIAAAAYHDRYGVSAEAIVDPLRDALAHIPYRDPYLHLLSTLAARHAHRRMVPPRKVVVVDCDNTLWEGVVGEVGAGGVILGVQHRALQEVLVGLSQAGLLVCLCSKNEEPDVWSAIDTRSDFPLRREHIVAAMVNWSPKSQNIRTLAARLNLGLDSFIFLDDNPVECAEVRAACPEVLTLEWPQDTSRAMALLQHTWELEATSNTREDTRRTQMYREEFRRQELRDDTLTFDEFISGLQLEVDVRPLDATDLARAAQLTLRTNQFNFTTIRRDAGDLEALVAAGTHDVHTVRVRDRFGDYGLVGLTIVERSTGAWALDTFLLSCRVLGRGVEHRVMAALGERAASTGVRAVRIVIEHSKRNAPARAFLESICPAGLLDTTAGGLACELPADALAAVQFIPASGAAAAPADEAPLPRAQAGDPAQPRRRERQIARAAFELSTVDALARLLSADPGAPAQHDAAGERDIEAAVYEAFSNALRVTPDTVRSVDRLDALGCSSMRVVEITVALTSRFPWLPTTLLFEHRSVSDISAAIAQLAARAPGTEPVAVPTPASAGSDSSADIAVVGMQIRCAGASSVDEFWQLLSSGRSAVRPVPPDRESFVRPLVDSRPHWAGLLDNVARFDAEFFGVSPREAEFMDPQLRLFLEVAWGALEDAGSAGSEHEPDTGVFVGVMYNDYGAPANAVASETANPYRCWEGFSLANRLSQLLGFHGPSIAVDTACSSSGTALHLACTALKSGDCRAALVGGVNLILDPDRFASLGRLGILSNRGQCEPFGADADGTILGEGAGAVLLRPLDEARRRGDRIYGVIKGTGISTGSGTVGFTAPNPRAQAQAIRRALVSAGVDPRTITYIETHGTGTSLGDPIEVRGLELAYGDEALHDRSLALTPRCTIGSIKPNIGHLEAGAGIAGLIKVLLQLHRGTRVPSLTSATPNAQIPFDRLPFSVQTTLERWDRPTAQANGATVPIPRRAGISSFGVGGANAHVIVEEAAEASPSTAASPSTEERPIHLLTVSGRDDHAVARQAAAYARHFEAHPNEALGDFCSTVNTGRRHLDVRLALAVIDAAGAASLLHEVASGNTPARVARGRMRPGSRPKVAFLFTGQGAQYAGMGRRLYETQPVFRDALDRCVTLLDRELEHPLLDVMFAGDGSSHAGLLDQTGFTQPALFAFEYAVSRLWESWGIVPDVVLGHSVGEIGAMCMAGGLTLEDAAKLIAARARLMQALPAGGAMASVMADEQRVLEALAGHESLVSVAAINAPRQVVISGAGAAIAGISARLSAAGIKVTPLTVSHAFHSPLMQPMLAAFDQVTRGIAFTAPRIPVVSCVEGEVRPDLLTRPDYWVRQVSSPVRFAKGIATLAAHGVSTLVEVGPHPVLLGMGRQCVPDDRAAEMAWLPSMRKGVDDWDTLLGSLAKLYVAGASIDWRSFDEPYHRTRVSAPNYQFSATPHWLRHTPPAMLPRNGHRIPESFALTWPEVEAPDPAEPAAFQWVIVPDSAGIASALIETLRTRGACVSTLEQHETALTALRQASSNSSLPLRVVTCEALDLDADPAVESHSASTSLVLARLAGLLAALDALGTPATLHVVTRDAIDAGDPASRVQPWQHAFWGFGRTAALEYPSLWGGLVDIDATVSTGSLLAELLATDGEDQVALRPGRRHAARLDHRALPPSHARITPDGTYLITGGTGAIGLRLARWLVERGARHLVLTSRRGGNGARTLAELAALEQLGARVDTYASDVSQAAHVTDLLRRLDGRRPPLRGIFHLAGVDTRTSIGALATEDIAAALQPKAAGAWLLHEQTRHVPLDFFVCFSSMASVFGAQGRAHYAAANAVLDALACERRRLGLPVASINWGPWRGAGMADGDQLAQFERIGNAGLDPGSALHLLESLIGGGTASTVVADIDWRRFRAIYESRRRSPMLLTIASGYHAAAIPSASSGQPDASASSPSVTARPDDVAGRLREAVARALGYSDPAAIDGSVPLTDIGMDSLLAAEVAGMLQRDMGIAGVALFDYPTLDALTAHVLGTIGSRSTAPATSVSPAVDGPRRLAFHEVADEALFAFQRVQFPDRAEDQILPRWHWMFGTSARRAGIEPRVWVYRHDGQIVGQTGAIPVRVTVDREEIEAAWLVDTMIAPAYRPQALGSRMMFDAQREVPIGLSLGQSPEMREIQQKLGWTVVAPLQVAQLLLRPERVLRAKIGAPVAWAAGAGLRASTALRSLLLDAPSASVKTVVRFEARHDAAWQAMAATVRCSVVRDASYLNWKYRDQPGQEFVCLDVCTDSGHAVAVLTFREADATYRYRRALLVDVVAPLSDPALLREVVRASINAAEEGGADALWCLHTSAALTESLREAGFLLREPSRVLMLHPESLPAHLHDRLLDRSAWFLTQGDSDIDRPGT